MTLEDTPTARALRVLDLIQRSPGITAAALAERLGTTDRAARRHISNLRDAGIPIEALSGPHGGYSVGRGIRLAPLMFSASEALGLVMAILEGRRIVPASDDPVETGLRKLIRALPEPLARPASLVHDHTWSSVRTPEDDPDRRPADPEITATIVSAVADGRRIDVSYRGKDSHVFDAVLDPWAVIVRHGRWYLLCHSHRADATRTYRVDRVLSVRVLDQTCAAPPELDAVAELERHLGRGWRFETRVVFDASIDQVQPWISGPMGVLETLDDGHCRLTGSTQNPGMYAGEWLAGLPFAFRVEGGDELRAAVCSLAERLRAAADGSDGFPVPPEVA